MSGFYSLFGNVGSPAAVIALAAIAVMVYVYVGYPVLVGVLSVIFRRGRPDTGHTPPLSVLISAYNEEGAIARKIEQTLALDYPSEMLEVLVVSDGSIDKTDEIVRGIGDPRVRLLRVEGRTGK